jgi:hypothetical protein
LFAIASSATPIGSGDCATTVVVNASALEAEITTTSPAATEAPDLFVSAFSSVSPPALAASSASAPSTSVDAKWPPASVIGTCAAGTWPSASRSVACQWRRTVYVGSTDIA